MPGRDIGQQPPTPESDALRDLGAPQYLGLPQYQALRRQARRQLIVQGFKEVSDGKEEGSQV